MGGPRSLSLFTGQEVWEGKAGEIEGLVRDWVSWQQSSDKSAFSMLARVLEHLSPEDTGPSDSRVNLSGFQGTHGRYPQYGRFTETFRFYFASAGIQRISAFDIPDYLVVARAFVGL